MDTVVKVKAQPYERLEVQVTYVPKATSSRQHGQDNTDDSSVQEDCTDCTNTEGYVFIENYCSSLLWIIKCYRALSRLTKDDIMHFLCLSVGALACGLAEAGWLLVVFKLAVMEKFGLTDIQGMSSK